MELDCCCLAGVDFLGAMEVDLGVRICKNNNKNKRGRGKGSKKACGGKMKGRVGIYRAQNIRRYEGCLRSCEVCLRSGVEIFVAGYPKVGKG